MSIKKTSGYYLSQQEPLDSKNWLTVAQMNLLPLSDRYAWMLIINKDDGLIYQLTPLSVITTDLVNDWTFIKINRNKIYVSVPTYDDMLNIPVNEREIGMIVHCVLEDVEYRLTTGLTNTDWELIIYDHYKLLNKGTHTHSEIDSFINSKGQANGLVPLGSNNTIDNQYIPALAIMDTIFATSEAEMLASDCQKGDLCIRSDQTKTYILKQEPATTLSNWATLLFPGSVVSVNGKTGIVTISLSELLTNLTNNYLTKYNGTTIVNSLFSDDGTTPKYGTNTIWHSGNDGVGSLLDAGLFRGKGELVAGACFNTVPVVGSDGVMDVGRYIDFHETNADTSDYSNRLLSNGLGSLLLNGQTIWHAGIANLSTVDWTAKDLTVTTAKIGTLSGYLKGTAGVVGAVASIPESDISFTDNALGDASSTKHGFLKKLSGLVTDVYRGNGTWGSKYDAFSTATYGSTITIDCNSGLNRNITATGNFTLAFTNLVNGMSGEIALTNNAITNITCPAGSKKAGTFTAIAIGYYRIAWSYNGSYIAFNIGMYE